MTSALRVWTYRLKGYRPYRAPDTCFELETLCREWFAADAALRAVDQKIRDMAFAEDPIGAQALEDTIYDSEQE